MSKAGHISTNAAELASSNQKRRNLHSNARVMLTNSCQEDKDTYLAEQWHFIPCSGWKVYLVFLQNVTVNTSSLQTVSRTEAISLNCLKKFLNCGIVISKDLSVICPEGSATVSVTVT